MGVYITTSKNPSDKTKLLCESLSSVLPDSVNERRGKKSIEQVFLRANTLGKRRVMLVYENDGIPSKICFMKVKAHSWEWIGAELLISGFRINKLPKELPNEIMLRGERKDEFERFFDFEESEDDFIELNCERKKLSFSYEDKPLIELELIS